VFDYEGDILSFSLSAELSSEADAYCERNGLTPYMLFAGVFTVLLGKISGQTDIVVGSPVSNRYHPELKNVCGPFMGTLPLRLRAEGDGEEYFRRLKDTVIEMLDYGSFRSATCSPC
jgi:surfactin family lipopeptide synthetase A